METLCFAPFVWGRYDVFIPIYTYSILRSYPDYYVKTFLRGPLDERVANSLQVIRDNISDRFDVVENYCNDLVTGDTRLLRWLIPEDYFYDFDNVYFGDVDILVVKENPSILDSHLKHCADMDLSYSNVIRSDKRLTGLHFVKRKSYYEKINSVIKNYLENPGLVREFILTAVNPCDECFLYYLLEDIGLPTINSFRPHHGLHISRHFRPGLDRIFSQDVAGSFNNLHSILSLLQESTFIKMLDVIKNKYYISTNMNNLRDIIKED
jgi:hypothetical protein